MHPILHFNFRGLVIIPDIKVILELLDFEAFCLDEFWLLAV